MELCPHDEDPSICPPCRRAAGKSNQIDPEDGKGIHAPFIARFDGQCFGCNLPITEGQWIRKRGQAYVHEDC